MLNKILQMQQWFVKGIKQAESMMREAKARIAIWQKRTKSLRSEQEPGMMIVICTLLFSKFDSEVRKDVFNAEGRDASSKDAGGVPNGTQPVMIDFEYMKSIVELVKKVDDQNRPSPMDLGCCSEVHDCRVCVLEPTRVPPSGHIIMMIGRPIAPKGKIHNGMMTRSTWQPLPRQMRLTEKPSTPSMVKEAKEARARRAKVKAMVITAKDKERM